MIHTNIQQDIWGLPAGTVIRVRHDWYDHVGLLSDHLIEGERGVLAFSAQEQGFVEQAFHAFAQGRQVRIDGYPGSLPPDIVMHRAWLKRGQVYSWVNFNCEHFVHFAHGLPIESPQLRQWAFLGSVVGLLVFAVRA